MNTNSLASLPRGSHTRLLAMAAALLLGASAAHAQNYITLNVSQELTLTTSPSTRFFGLHSNGSIYSAGPRVGGVVPWDTPSLDLRSAPGNAYGQVSTFLWDAGRSAFRAGLFGSDTLNPATIGPHSFAYGYSNLASGAGSLAGGLLTQAPGYGSAALGSGSTATGAYSFAVGDHATAIEADTFAAGAGATALTHASAAFNYGTLTTGFSSFAAGYYTKADSFASFVVGCWNLGGYAGPNGAWQWNGQDPVFEVGNGTGPATRSNALTVYKDGTVIIPKRQGDILMGEFTN